jgi:tetratricopeptide (TPR) repeat protein
VDSDTLKDASGLAGLYLRDEKFPEAEALLIQLVEARNRTVDVPDQASVTYMIELIEAYEKQRKSDHVRQVREKLEAGFRVLGEKNEITQSGLASLFTFYLDNYPERPEAEALFKRFEDTYVLRIASTPGPEGSQAMIELVQVYRQLGRFEQANQLSAAFEARVRTFDVRNPLTISLINNFKLRTGRSLPDLVDLVNAAMPESGTEIVRYIPTIAEVAKAYYDQGKYPEAERLYIRALEASNRLLAMEDPDSLRIRMALAGVYVLEGKLDIAEESFNELVGINRRASGPEAKSTLLTMTLLGWTRIHQQKYIEVEVDLREVLRSLEQTQPNEWERYNCQSILGASLAGQKRFAEAEPILLSAYDGMMSRQSTVARAYPIRPKLQEEGGTRIVQLYQDWGRPEKAAEWREKLRDAVEHALREPPRK